MTVAAVARPVARLRVLPWALGGLTAGALLLRLVAVDSRGLWGDEAWRVWAARLPSALDVLRVAWAQPPSAPLYWLALHAWILVAGHGDVAVRLLSVPAAAAAVPALAWLGRLTSGRAARLLAAALLAVSPLAVEIGQEATMYAWTGLFATLVVAAGLAWLITGRGATAYVAAATLLLYTHYMGALLLGELFAVGLIWQARPGLLGDAPAGHRAPWLRLHALIALLWAPWLVAMSIRLAQRWDEYAHLEHRAGWADVRGLIGQVTMGASAAGAWPRSVLAFAVTLGAALLALGLWTHRRPAQRLVWIPALLAAGFLAVIVGGSALTGAWLVQPRFLALVLPLLLVPAGAGLAAGLRGARPAAPAALAALLLAGWLVAQGAGVLAFYRDPVHGRDGLRTIGALLTARVRPGDLVVSNAGLLLWQVAQYYDGPTQGLPASQDVRDGYALWPPPAQPAFVDAQWAALEPRAAGARRVWLIYLPANDPGGRLLALVGARYPPLGSASYPFATVYLFAGGAGP